MKRVDKDALIRYFTDKYQTEEFVEEFLGNPNLFQASNFAWKAAHYAMLRKFNHGCRLEDGQSIFGGMGVIEPNYALVRKVQCGLAWRYSSTAGRRTAVLVMEYEIRGSVLSPWERSFDGGIYFKPQDFIDKQTVDQPINTWETAIAIILEHETVL